MSGIEQVFQLESTERLVLCGLISTTCPPKSAKPPILELPFGKLRVLALTSNFGDASTNPAVSAVDAARGILRQVGTRPVRLVLPDTLDYGLIELAAFHLNNHLMARRTTPILAAASVEQLCAIFAEACARIGCVECGAIIRRYFALTCHPITLQPINADEWDPQTPVADFVRAIWASCELKF